MKAVKLYEKISAPIVLALGFFDSIHIGHRKIIGTCVAIANKKGVSSALLTFDNNPFLALDKDIPLVYNFVSRLKILSETPLDFCLYRTFDRDFMSMPPEEFLNLLKNHYTISHIVCGFDYKFGQKSTGDANTLKKFFGAENVTVIDKVEFCGKKAGSTDVRGMLISGDIERANECLGVPYRIYGVVENGHKIGRRLGFPTANISSNTDTLIKEGVYGVYAELDGRRYDGIANVGGRPTFMDETRKMEVNIFDFGGDIYGKEVTVYFVRRLRDVKKFASQEELKKQIESDIRQLRG